MTSQGLIGVFAVFGLSCTLHAQRLSYDPEQLTLVAREDLPRWGTFWVQGPNGPALPLPFPPGDMPDAPIYALPNGQFLVDGSAVQRSAMRSSAMNLAIPGGEGTPDDPQTPPPNIPNYQKFMGQAFSLIDTNDAAVNDPNLYNGCVLFPDSTNTGPFLQIARYGTNAVIIKANHFDYSAETRDFALLVCDKVETPTWKNIELSGSSDTQDGWLVQGAVSSWRVSDAMFLLVSNLNLSYNAFFRAAPYGGPQVQITGAQPYDTVTGTVPLHAAISDLSGTTTTNQQMAVMVNGLSTRYTLGPSNTISLDTLYAQSGSEEVEVTLTSSPVAYDAQNPPMDTRLAFDTTTTLPLDFENHAFLVNASDFCSLEVGTNYILFGVSQPDQVQAVISEPSSGRLLATYSTNLSSAGTVVIPWNFTELDGVTPYTNETYRVHFVAEDPTSMDITNTIVTSDVRFAGGVILTYAEEPNNGWLNQQANTWVNQTLSFLYNDIYDQSGLTQYYWWDIGDGRNLTTCYVDTPSLTNGWRNSLQQALAGPLYSDITIGPMHGSKSAIAATGGEAASTWDLALWTYARAPNWRMRKAAVWSCYSGEGYDGSATGAAPGRYPWFPDAFGVRPKPIQYAGLMKKNSCLCFKKDWDQRLNIAEIEAAFDTYWVTGANGYPGACDPTWAISWALRQTIREFPFVEDAEPVLAGYQWLIYTAQYDEDLMRNDASRVKGK